MSNHVLYLSYDGISDPLGQSQVLPYLKGLAAKGFVIHLITAEKNIDLKDSIRIKQELNTYGIHWQFVHYTKKPPIISTLWDIRKIKKETKKILKEREIKLIHCRGYITGIVGLSCKLKRGIPFLFDMRGFFADERKDSGNWNIKNPIYKKVYTWFKKKEVQFFNKADHIISLTYKGKEIIQNEIIKSNSINIEVIPCCVDTKKFDYCRPELKERSKIRKELNISEEAVVFTYLGSIGTWYMLDEMIDFFKTISIKIPNAIFLFISNESPLVIEKAIERKAADKKLFRMISKPSSLVPEYLSISDWGLFFILPVFSKKASSPTKLAEFLAMGIPVITNTGVGDVDEIIEKNKAGIIVNGTDDKSYYQAVEEIQAFEKQGPDFYRAISQKYFDVEIGIEKYYSVYKRIICNN